MPTIKGKVVYIYPPEQKQSAKNGRMYYSRDIVITPEVFDRGTGGMTYDETNTPLLTVFGRIVDRLNEFKVGDKVIIDFQLKSRRYRDREGKERISTDIQVTSVSSGYGNPFAGINR